MLKILIIMLLLIVVLLSGLACRHMQPGNSDVRNSPSPSPSESRDSSRPDAVKHPPKVQVRLVGLTLGMSLDSVIAIMRKRDLIPNKKPGTRRYDFIQNKEMADICHFYYGPSIVVDDNNRIEEIIAIEGKCLPYIGINGTNDELKYGDTTKKIIAMLGEPQQKINIGHKKEDWLFPHLGLVLTVIGPDHSPFAARLKKSDKE